MSSIEERLERDISAVMRGVVMTERDLLDARAAVDERIETDSRRGRRMTLLATAAVVAGVAAVGLNAYQAISDDNAAVAPAGGGDVEEDIYAEFLSGEAPTPKNLNGFWRVDNAGTMVLFREDGTVQFSDGGTVISRPDSGGTYEIVGDAITVTNTGEDVIECGGRNPRLTQLPPDFTLRAALPDPGHVNIVLPDAQLGTCESLPTTITLEHVIPTNSGFEDFDNSDLRGWKRVNDDTFLYGDWMAEGGGYLLELAEGRGEDPEYYVVDKSAEVVDNGYWRLRDGALELFSRTESPQCKEGDWLVLGDLEGVSDGTDVFRGNLDRNDCGGDWTPVSWILIPDTTS